VAARKKPAPVVSRERVLALYRYLEADHTLFELLPDGTRVIRPTTKPATVILAGFGVELGPGEPRVFRSIGGRRLPLANPERQLRQFLERFERVCRHYRIGGARGAKPSPRPDARRLARALTGVLDLLVGGLSERSAEAVRRQALLSLEDPDKYVVRYRTQMADRGISGVPKNLHVFALVDSLWRAGVIAVVDWRAHPDEVKRAAARLLRRRDIPIAKVWPSAADDRDTRSLLRALARALVPLRQQLWLVDLGNDDRTFLVADHRDRHRLRTAFFRLGMKVSPA
jgi:hypothetical protein